MLAQLRRLLAPLQRRVMLLVSRAVVIQTAEEGQLERLQLRGLHEEVLDGVERVGAYGLYSRPLPGAPAIVVCVGGNRDHPVVVATDDHRHRPRNLAPGEVCLLTDEGDRIWLRRGRRIEVETHHLVATAQTVEVVASQTALVEAGEEVRLRAPTVVVEGNLEVTGSIEAAGSVADATSTMQVMRNVYNNHNHPTGSSGPPNPPMA